MDSVYRFLLTSRWLTLSVLALLAIPFCLFMGTWQLSRFDAQVDQQRNAKHNEQQTATAAPVPLRAVLPDPGATVFDDDFGRIVSATGRYDAAHQYLIPDRTLDDRDGFYVLTPLRLSSGAALPVVRGWLPGDASAAEKAGTVPAPPTGQVTVDGAMQYPETTDTAEVETGQLPSGQL
ncbi:MAG: hypothetical protein QOF98_2822, partial [Streptomyces sp.]|nr:hypothetical protein [Streptomyces sp.]